MSRNAPDCLLVRFRSPRGPLHPTSALVMFHRMGRLSRQQHMVCRQLDTFQPYPLVRWWEIWDDSWTCRTMGTRTVAVRWNAPTRRNLYLQPLFQLGSASIICWACLIASWTWTQLMRRGALPSPFLKRRKYRTRALFRRTSSTWSLNASSPSVLALSSVLRTTGISWRGCRLEILVFKARASHPGQAIVQTVEVQMQITTQAMGINHLQTYLSLLRRCRATLTTATSPVLSQHGCLWKQRLPPLLPVVTRQPTKAIRMTSRTTFPR